MRCLMRPISWWFMRICSGGWIIGWGEIPIVISTGGRNLSKVPACAGMTYLRWDDKK
jgi:hypothetical protein